ncbi:hypothetical protein Tco_0012376, partial [Tanacetum coccineum]
ARLAGIPIELGSLINVAKSLPGDNQDEGSIGPQDQMLGAPRSRLAYILFSRGLHWTARSNAANLEIVEVKDDATHQTGSSSKQKGKMRKQDALKRGNLKGSVHLPFLSAAFPKGVGKHPWIMARQFGIDEQDIDPFVPGDHFHVLLPRLAMTGNMLKYEYVIMARDFSKLKDEVIVLKSKQMSYKHELEKLEDALSRARNNQDVEGSQAVMDLRSESTRLFEELAVLRLCPFVEEVKRLRQKCRSFKDEKDTLLSKEVSLRNEVDALSSRLKVVDLERIDLVKDFLLLAALNDVYGLGDFWDLKYIADYDPEAKKNFDGVKEAFYKVEFPYISMFTERAGQSLGELATVEPPVYQEATLAPPL